MLGKLDALCGALIVVGFIVPFTLHVWIVAREVRHERAARAAAARRPVTGFCFKRVEWSGHRGRRPAA